MQLNGLGSYRANNLSTPWNNAATSKELAAAHPNASGLSAGLSALRGATKAAPVTPTNTQVNTNTAKVDDFGDEVQVSPTANTRACLLYTSPSPRDISGSRMPSSA